MATEIEEPTSPFGWDLINDLSALPFNEDIIIDYLLERLQRGEIYTWVGALLLVLNPCSQIPQSDIYSFYEYDKYINVPSIHREEAIPHIFTVAAKAHSSLTQEIGRNCQVIIISGETGTGKTYNACKCLEFLSAVNRNPAVSCQRDYTNNIMLRITDACRLISAFTTASTERNQVSSRHGQLVRLHYKGGAISGAAINSFLLERSRVTKSASNFQIFYQMMFGMSDAELATYNLYRNEDYDILSVIDYTKKTYYQEGFQETIKAFEVLGFEEDQKKQIFQVLALIINMGNIQFVDNNDTCTVDLTDRKSNEALKNTCILSSLNEEDIVELLTSILINPQNTWRKYTACHRNLVNVDACRNRLYSIIRHIYDLLFQWILDRTNDDLYVKHQYLEWLGILDIFGFESFNENGIEQLCVNYANEKMQQYFIETHLENSRKDLEEESFIDSTKPLDIINLYNERLHVMEEVLFPILNDACQSPVTIDVSTIIQLACGGNPQNVKNRFLKEQEERFIIEHYSGPVAYSIKDLLSKNTDKVPTEISITFSASQNTFLRTLINIDEENYLHKTSTRKRTMLAKLKYNMDALVKELSTCDLHYVRCIKPSQLNDGKWDRRDFRKQLACTGIFDALPLAKCKYPIRLGYEDFCRRYSKKYTEIHNADKCQMILESIAPRKRLYTLVYYGKRLIFLTEFVFFKLEYCRRNYRIKCANKIQSFWIKYRHNRTPVSSKHSRTTCKLLREQTNDHESKTLKCELKLSQNNEEDDDVFINPVNIEEHIKKEPESCITSSQEVEGYNTKAVYNAVHLESEANLIERKSSASRKSQHVFEGSQGEYTNEKDQFKDSYILNCLKNIVKLANGEESIQSFLPHCKDVHNNRNDIDFNYQYDDNNNNNRVIKPLQEPEENYKEKCTFYFNKECKSFTIQLGSNTFFYKNRILSRRRLAGVPIKVHTRSTCLINSHMLPRCELPQGLQDCL